MLLERRVTVCRVVHARTCVGDKRRKRALRAGLRCREVGCGMHVCIDAACLPRSPFVCCFNTNNHSQPPLQRTHVVCRWLCPRTLTLGSTPAQATT